MKFNTFIVVDDTLKKNTRDNTCTFTVNGDVIYPIGVPMPVIRKGKGCVGVGIIISSTRNGTSTSITFTISNVNDASAKAYYSLYQNNISVSNDSDDAYENASDMIIPGMIANVSKTSKKSNNSRRSGRSSLSDYLEDDDYHW